MKLFAALRKRVVGGGGGAGGGAGGGPGGNGRAPEGNGAVRRATGRRVPAPTFRAPPPPEGRGSKYDALVETMLERHDIRVRKWRTSMSGIAVLVRHADGREERLLEAPYPRGPMSVAVFLHEVAHHAIGVASIKPRCLEEWAAWRMSLSLMREAGVNVTPPVERRMQRSLELAVRRAVRRGMRRLPEELVAYCPADWLVPPPKTVVRRSE